jgi:hypothetical protein
LALRFRTASHRRRSPSVSNPHANFTPARALQAGWRCPVHTDASLRKSRLAHRRQPFTKTSGHTLPSLEPARARGRTGFCGITSGLVYHEKRGHQQPAAITFSSALFFAALSCAMPYALQNSLIRRKKYKPTVRRSYPRFCIELSFSSEILVFPNCKTVRLGILSTI